ncbi:hypothetical protein ACFL1N_15670 [Thermodesulfobacteriota bacterium]
MKSNKRNIVWGIITGIALSFLYFNFFAPRYEIKKTSTNTMKIDKWTGESWRLVDDNWRKMINMDDDWALIDKALQDAIKISLPVAKVDPSIALKKLRDRYPVLKDIPDYDLLERIKLVYSKQVMVGMYLGDFMSTSESAESSGNP